MAEKFVLVRVFNGGKVTIPQGIRKKLSLRDGDYLAVTLNNEEAKITYFPVSIKPTKQ